MISIRVKRTATRAILVLPALLLAFTGYTASTVEKPNVLLILADDLGIGGLGCYGTEYLETPHIDTIAAEGMRFTNGLAAFPTCKPSRAAMLTGQYSPRTGVYRVVDRHTGQEDKIKYLVPPNEDVSIEKRLINQPFKDSGYATAAFGKWHISNPRQAHPTEYGFDRAIESSGGHYNAKAVPVIDLPEGVAIEEFLTTEAIGFMNDSVAAKNPFFLYMPYFLIHRPLEAKSEYIEHFEKKLEGIEFIGKHVEEMPTIAAMTRMLDDEVGRLLDCLESLDIVDNTIIVFASDNGAFNENLVGEFRGQKGQTYEGGLRVPYLFKWKDRIEAGSLCDERIIGVDLYPTLLKLAEIESTEEYPLDGYDLSSLLLGHQDSIPTRSVYCYFPKYTRFNKKTERWAESWRNVIYHGKYKLIDYPEYGEKELFDLDRDPQEKNNLANQLPEKLRELDDQLDQWLDSVQAPELTLNPDYSLK